MSSKAKRIAEWIFIGLFVAIVHVLLRNSYEHCVRKYSIFLPHHLPKYNSYDLLLRSSTILLYHIIGKISIEIKNIFRR